MRWKKTQRVTKRFRRLFGYMITFFLIPRTSRGQGTAPMVKLVEKRGVFILFSMAAKLHPTYQLSLCLVPVYPSEQLHFFFRRRRPPWLLLAPDVLFLTKLELVNRITNIRRTVTAEAAVKCSLVVLFDFILFPQRGSVHWTTPQDVIYNVARFNNNICI